MYDVIGDLEFESTLVTIWLIVVDGVITLVDVDEQ